MFSDSPTSVLASPLLITSNLQTSCVAKEHGVAAIVFRNPVVPNDDFAALAETSGLKQRLSDNARIYIGCGPPAALGRA